MLKMKKEVNKTNMFKFIYFSILIMIAFLPTVSAIDFGYDYLEHTTTSFNNATVNSSSNWVTTSLGVLDDANSTQFENNGGELSIVLAWFSTAWNNVWDTKSTGDLTDDDTYVEVAGDSMTGYLNVTGNIKAKNLTLNSSIYFGDTLMVVMS